MIIFSVRFTDLEKLAVLPLLTMVYGRGCQWFYWFLTDPVLPYRALHTQSYYRTTGLQFRHLAWCTRRKLAPRTVPPGANTSTFRYRTTSYVNVRDLMLVESMNIVKSLDKERRWYSLSVRFVSWYLPFKIVPGWKTHHLKICPNEPGTELTRI